MTAYLNFLSRLTLVILLTTPLAAGGEDAEGRSLMQTAQRLVAAYHAGQSHSQAMLRVVYFVPHDRKPLPGHAERVDRIMNDVSNFYREGLRRYGLEISGLPLERKDGKLVLHIVRGKSPASEYHYESGVQTASEIRDALKGTVDFAREHVLVFYALCRKEPDGRYVFDAPYYGSGSQRGGLCHAADCELLDPLLLKESKRTLVYTEHYYPRVKETVATFNSKYLGGIAHELGHGLGLPHDAGSLAEQRFGAALMGYGNLHYREDLWGGHEPAYLARASALQLLSHPLITGSDRGRWDDENGGFDSLNFSATGGVLQVQGTASGTVPPYAVIAYVWPTTNNTDHAARTFPVVLTNGAFTLALEGLRTNLYHLKLATLHVNGGTSEQVFRFGFNVGGGPEFAALNAAWMVDHAEREVMCRTPQARELLSDAALVAAPTPESGRKLRLLRSVLDPEIPLDLATVQGNSVFLSDAQWKQAKVGWGQVARNYFWFDQQIQNGVFLMLSGLFYDKGLYAHSPARYVFTVGQKWKTFSATIGLRDGAQTQGSAIFIVRGDGRELFRSRILRVGQQARLNVEITQVNELELQTQGGEGHHHNSWAIWVEPKLQR